MREKIEAILAGLLIVVFVLMQVAISVGAVAAIWLGVRLLWRMQ